MDGHAVTDKTILSTNRVTSVAQYLIIITPCLSRDHNLLNIH